MDWSFWCLGFLISITITSYLGFGVSITITRCLVFGDWGFTNQDILGLKTFTNIHREDVRRSKSAEMSEKKRRKKRHGLVVYRSSQNFMRFSC